MGTTVDAVAVVTGGSHIGRRNGALALTDAAAEACLARAGIEAGEVDLLVNVGIYHDKNLGEPALAALIQEDIGAHPEDPHGGGHGTFSFDVANGACGMLTGLRVVHGFLSAGTIRHALVVAGDANPGRRLTNRFPFAPTGAAIACGWQDDQGGLVAFRFGNRPGADLFRGRVGVERGRNKLRIEEAPEFAARAGSLAGEVAGKLLTDRGLAPDDVDVVVANPLTPAFLAALRTELGLSGSQVVAADGRPPVHTAGLAVAWDEARQQDRLTDGATVLLVSAGAGLTAGAAVLRMPPAPPPADRT
ncbi:MAG TPA: 3-oxoacyl-[acyl-carrier-protein] synthase III C-terminal domain-containing protein [Acidimicrobiales bacterium]|nr:3-oxoacyl-[acyl-carrier-protein] synthase III C-terminal domain-containing protein [Acidimicrobiales bacterium]